MTDIESKFPKIYFPHPSLIFFEMQIMSHNPFEAGEFNVFENIEGFKVIMKRRRNVMEVINLEKVDNTGIQNKNKGKRSRIAFINLADMKDIAQFLYFNLKTSNISSFSVGMKNDQTEKFGNKNSQK